MTWRLIAFALTAFAPTIVAGQAAPDDPRAVVRAAAAAVRGDSVPTIRDRWQARVARDSSDRAALLGLATLDRLTYDYLSAERIYRGLASATTSDRFTVYALLGLGRGFDEYGRDAREVDELWVRALADSRALKDRTAEGEALVSLAGIRSQSHGLPVALALIDSAFRVLPSGATDLQISARCRRAQMRIIMGRGERGAQLASAMALARRATDPRARAACVRARAIALGNRGRSDSAAAVYAAHAETLRRVHDHSGYALALAWQASELRDVADYGEAREVLAVARREAELSHNLYTGAYTELLLGQVSLTLNDYGAAVAYFDQAVAGSGEVADSEMVYVSRSWRALARLATGDLAGARRESLETLVFFEREGDLYNQAQVVKTLANIAIREQDWAAAARGLDSSEALFRRVGVPAPLAALPFDRGRLALYRGDFPLAEREFTRHMETLDSSEHLQRFEARAYLADTYARRGELGRAEDLLAAASDDVDRWRATLSARDLRVTAFQANTTAQNDRNASVARVLAALAASGRVESAFSLAERRRARELIDRMQQNVALSHPREGQAGLRAGLSKRVEQVTAAEVAEALPPRAALIEYITGALGAPTTVIVLTRGRAAKYLVRAKLLPPADSLTGSIGRFVALAARGEDATAAAKALGAVLLEPAVDLVGPDVTRLVIVPDGALHRVPWDALRLRDGRAAVERFAIGVAPSAALVTALWRTRVPDAGSPARLLAFGDPVFPAPGRSSSAGPDASFGTYESAFEANGGLPRLEGSGREVRGIARYARNSEVLLRESASESALERTRLASYRVIHFATHALVDDRVSVHTALALAPGNGEDGFVTPGELARLRLSADLVVLSACRTAGGVVVDGEGVQGLTAPLLEAGARSVVATSWRVGDERTVWFVERFYAALARGLPVADALREAKLEALRSGAGVKVWAAFTVVGDPFVTVRLAGDGEQR